MFIPPTITKLSLGLGLIVAFIHPALSQISANGAGTLVNPQGNQINISGGTQAGGNLFHSFQDFNVNSGQVANFLSNPQTQNILGRINGGNPSLINGLLQVTGGNSNLFLMNPAGIVFGQGASLNVPASFTATTANGIGFGNNVFNALGDNNFLALTGNPDSFIFTTNQAGSIVNAGNLAVGNGQNLSLIAGTSINTGRLTAPGGEIQVLAVPGTNRVRLSQPGQVLSLEIVPPENNQLRGVDLPALLTGQNLPGIVTSGETIQVAGTTLPSSQGLAVASGRINVSNPLGNGGVVQVLGDRVAILNSRINANGATGGGTVRLGGEYLGGINTGIAPALRFNSQRTLVDRNSFISTNATNSGNGGRVIVWADDTTGFYGRITGRGATGSGGFTEVSGKVNLDFDGRVELPGANGLFGTLLLDPTNITIVAGANGTQTDDAQVNVDATILSGDTPVNMTISAGALAFISPNTAINIAATNNITFNTSVTFKPCTAGTCGAITFTAGGAFNTNGNNITARGRNFSVTAASITATGLINTSIVASGNNAFGNAGNITLTATTGNITTSNLFSYSQAGGSSESGNAGNITLTATTGNITTNNLSNYSEAGGNGESGNGGNITLTAQNITTSDLFNYSNARGSGISLNGGNTTLTATSGNITTSGLFNSALANGNGNSGNGGNVNLTATNGNISTSYIFSESNDNTGGAVEINAGNLFLATGSRTARDGTSASISTQGGTGGGPIIITHRGSTSDPFVVGNATNNGTSRAITSSSGNTINNQTIPVTTAVYNFGNVSITGSDPTPSPTPSPSPTPTPSPIPSPSPTPTPSPSPIPTPSPSPSPTPSPSPSPSPIPTTSPSPTPIPSPSPSPSPIPTPSPSSIPTPSPSLIPSPIPTPLATLTPSISFPILTNLTGVNTNPQIPQLTSELPSGTIFLITNPTIPEISSRLSSLEESFRIVEVPVPIPSPISSSTPSISSAILTSLTGVNTNPQIPQLTSEPFLGNITLITNPTIPEISPRLDSLEESFQSEFQQYLGITSQVNSPQSLQETQTILNQITATTGVKPALVYVFFAPEGSGNFSSIDLASQINRTARDTDILEAVVITGTGEPVRVRLPGTTRRQVLEVANNFRSEVTNFRNSRGFLNPAQQMYKWILEPLEEDLQKQGINNLVFLMDSGLRSIPLAAMHDGKGFIVERYSVGLMPSLNLTPLDHRSLEGSEVLAMGATTFGDSGLNPLPAVSLELNAISQIWEGAEFLNETFTLNNLIQQRQNRPFRIIHLATHGVFNPGDRSNSYIQLWDGRLGLDQLKQLNWGNPPVDLLVLSACQTALGDKDAELGFAGLAINAGVRSALASLWEVNDAATLGLMTKFYQQLQVASTKSEALRQAQLAMIRGEVRLENGNLVTADGLLPLSEEIRNLSNINLTHPYYWSAFTMVGNPW